MRFLADENIEVGMVSWLRSLGHDVLDVRTTARGAEDADLLDAAVAEGRVFVTYDLDFGELAFRQRRPHVGIVLLRLTETTAGERLDKLKQHWPTIEPRCQGRFTVVHSDRIRFRPAAGSA